jgi:pre-rRNA-processing protein TSR3
MRHKKDTNPKNKKYAPARPPKPRGDASTSSSGKLPYKAACWDLGHCDPKRCSGKRLMQFGMMRELAIGQRFPGVIVS